MDGRVVCNQKSGLGRVTDVSVSTGVPPEDEVTVKTHRSLALATLGSGNQGRGNVCGKVGEERECEIGMRRVTGWGMQDWKSDVRCYVRQQRLSLGQIRKIAKIAKTGGSECSVDDEVGCSCV